MFHIFKYIPVGAFVGIVIMILLYIAIIACLVIYTLLHSKLFGRSSRISDGLVEQHKQLESAATSLSSG